MESIKMLTQEQLKQKLHYNHDVGIFTRLISNANCVKVGDIAGNLNKSHGYMVIKINGKNYLSHRLVWLYIYGEFPLDQIDHLNHIRTDNRISNLRTVTNQENLKNASKRKDNTSGITGVGWDKAKNKWRAQIVVDGKQIHLGYFTNKLEAITARKSANNKYGYHQNHGEDL